MPIVSVSLLSECGGLHQTKRAGTETLIQSTESKIFTDEQWNISNS